MDQNKNGRKYSFLTRKRLVVVVFVLALVAMIFTGTSMSLLKMNTEAVQNTFSKGSVGAKIVESVENNAKKAICVENTGDSPVYVRVKLVSYWLNADNSIAAKASPSISFELNSSWVASGGYYYYKSPVAGGSVTDNLISYGSQIQMQQDENGCKQAIEVLADAVQATPDDAVEELWGDAALELLK